MFLVSSTGIHVPLPEKGDAIGMFVPSATATRRYTDIQNPSKGAVKSRVGLDGADQPLWRSFEDRSVEFYGTVNESVTERRSSVSVYLPKDFLPEGFSVFYYIFKDRWVVHGERVVSDEGVASWVYTKFDTGSENLEDFIVGAISDRLVKGVRERICVAMDDCPESMNSIKDNLAHFDIDVVPFSSLKIAKVKPVYQHRDFGLFMLLGFFCGFALMAATVGIYAKSHFELNSVKEEVSAVQKEIQRMQLQMVLGFISNPDSVLRLVEQKPSVKPSTLIHETGSISSVFGNLEKINVSYLPITTNAEGKQTAGVSLRPSPARAVTLSTVKTESAQMLVDQERVAASLVKNKEHISQITRTKSDDKTIELAIQMQIGAAK